MPDTVTDSSEAVVVSSIAVPEQQATLKRGKADHLMATRFPKGVSGNPGGKPKGASFTALARRILEQKVPGQDHITNLELMFKTLFKQVLKGSTKSAEIILDRIDPKQTHVHKSEVTVLQLVFNDANPPDKWAPIDVDAIAHANQHELPATLEDDDDDDDEE